MILELSQEKKVLRFIDGYPESFLRPLEGVSVLWADRQFTSVVEISLGGIIVQKPPNFDSSNAAKNWAKGSFQTMEIRLQTPSHETTLPYEVEISRVSSQYIYFNFDILSPKSRLLIDQNTKDDLIKKSLQSLPLHVFGESDTRVIWIHGAFETNFTVWRNDVTGALEKFVIEYDNTLLFYKDKNIWSQRSSLSKTIGTSYFLFDENFVHKGPKMSLGSSWLARVSKILEVAEVYSSFDLREARKIISNQQSH